MVDKFRTILDSLDQDAQSYVLEKSKRPSAKIGDILQAVNVSRSAFYDKYDAGQRAELDRLAAQIHADKHFRALQKIDDHVLEAIETMLNLMRGAKSEFVKMQSAQTIIQYALGNPTMRFEGSMKVTDWRDEAVESIRNREIEFDPLAEQVGYDLATELFQRAGVDVAR